MARPKAEVKVRIWEVSARTAERRGAAFPKTSAANPEYYSAAIEDGKGTDEVMVLRTGRRTLIAGPKGVDTGPQHPTAKDDLLCWAEYGCARGEEHDWDALNDTPLGRNDDDEQALELSAPEPKAKRAAAANKPRARASKATTTEVEAITHRDSRTNIPTEQLRDFVPEEEPKQLLYDRDASLDPQLVWQGKDALDEEQLAVWLRPIFIQEKIHPRALIEELRRESKDRAGAPEQLDFFADFNGIDTFEKKVEFYQHDQHWSNRMILGDSLMVMASLAEKEGLRGQVQTIYLDPPYGIKFGSNWQVSTRKRDVRDGRAEDVTRQPEMVRAFRDTWQNEIHSYLTYLRDRFVVARDLLTESGSVFVQIGDENVHLVRSVLDEVFGSENFVSQIVFRKTTGKGSSYLDNTYDVILWFAKARASLKYRALFAPRVIADDANLNDVQLPDGSRRRMTTEEQVAPDLLPAGARPYRPNPLTSQSASTTTLFEYGYGGSTFRPSAGGWKTNLRGMERLDKSNRLHGIGRTLTFIRFWNDFPLKPMNDIWDDTRQSGFGDSKTYVVQTASKAIQHCILMTTDPGDLVLDPTCGSGTTAYVAEQWGRRWITIDTSRVALALARTRIMAARYPHYFLADSQEGRQKQAELLGQQVPDWSTPPTEDVRQGFVYKRVPHIQLRDIANNEEIDSIWERWQETLEPLRARLNAALNESWEEWEIPREGGDDWSRDALDAHTKWWEARRQRQHDIDESIARNSESEVLYDQPYEDNKKVRVAGPFTVESLSPHRVLDPAEALPRTERAAQDSPEQPGWESLVIDHLKTAGIQNTKRGERLKFTRLDAYANPWLHAEGEFEQDGQTKRVAVSIGPQWGTVNAEWVKNAAREAVRGVGFDVVAICALAFDGHASEAAEEFQPEADGKSDGHAIAEAQLQYGRLPVLLVRMNPDLAMGEDLLKKTGAANLFMVFGEPDIDIEPASKGSNDLVVRIRGVDIYDPTTGEVRPSSTDDIACWFIDTAYDETSFFVRHAYFTGDTEPYERLKRALRAEVDEEAWSSLYRTESRPFPRPETGKIAIKVINHYGDEVLKVYEV